MIQLHKDFSSVDGSKRSEWMRLRRLRLMQRDKADRKEKQEKQEKAENEMSTAGVGIVMANDVLIAAVEAKLDTYDTAIVAALLSNEKQLDAVRQRIQGMLDQAFVLDDGRRVFRTADGTQVFDEHGEVVSSEDVHVDQIDPAKSTWEEFSAEKQQKVALEAERSDILAFQDKVDQARERLADGEISEAELEALDAELADALPGAVRVQMPGHEQSDPSFTTKQTFSTAVKPDLLTKSGERIDPVVPGLH